MALQQSSLSRPLPMLATSSPTFDDERFLFEVKWDGVRCLTAVQKGKVRLWGREGSNYTGRYPELGILGKLPSGTILDGELVAVRDGRPDFHVLMRRHSQRGKRQAFTGEPILYVVFDMLQNGGRCLMSKPLSERRHRLH